jgi:hypothetical protein
MLQFVEWYPMKCNLVLDLCCPYLKLYKILLHIYISLFKLHCLAATRNSAIVKELKGEERKLKCPRDPEI